MKKLLIIIGLSLIPSFTYGQGLVTNPTKLQFNASADQNTTGLDGNPVLTYYEFKVFTESGSVLTSSINLGKPIPDGTGLIIINTTLQPQLFDGLQRNVRYVAYVSAIGPGGESLSNKSNPFGLLGAPGSPGIPSIIK